MKAGSKDTGEKIKRAARKLFMKKGFSRTSVRDIAAQARINVALMNYYYRSKEKLFEIIMMEYMKEFFDHMLGMLNREDLSLHEKVTLFADNYISLMVKQPELPLFVLGELRTRPDSFIRQMGVSGLFTRMRFTQEIQQSQRGKTVNPVHLFVSLLAMTVFPFIARPILMAAAGISNKQFNAMMEERKKLIPIWFDKLVQSK